MIKRLLLIFALFLVSGTCYAHVIPNEIQDYIKNSFPGTYFRYDGTVILPNNTIYLPIIPAKFDIETDKIDIKQTIPAGKSLANLPDAVIFNNDFTLLKVIKDKNNNFALLNQLTYPDEIKSGIFPQNLFLPRRLVIPEGLESVKGKLESFNERGDDIKSPITFSNNKSTEYFKSPLLKNKALYLTSTISKNIKVLNDKKKPFAYLQRSLPNKFALYDDRFLLITSYGQNTVTVISLYDNAVIKDINLKTCPDEIVVYNDTAYVSSSQGHCIYVIDLSGMNATKQILINGMCEKLTISDDGGKLFYYDKQAKTLWSVELDNEYLLKDVGIFPNVSKIVYSGGKVYVTSRTRNRIAIIDYNEMNLLGEYNTEDKPVDLCVNNKNLYILSAGGNKIQIINTDDDTFTSNIDFPEAGGFPSRFYKVDDRYLLITDTAKSLFYIFDTEKNEFSGKYEIDEPISNIQIGNQIKTAYD